MEAVTPTANVPYLSTALAALKAAHPGATIRLQRAARLVALGAVNPIYGIGHMVASESEAGRSYWVQRLNDVLTCECEDFRQRGGPCKHGWAAVLFAVCERLDAEATDPTIDSSVVPFPTPRPEGRYELTELGKAVTAELDCPTA